MHKWGKTVSVITKIQGCSEEACAIISKHSGCFQRKDKVTQRLLKKDLNQSKPAWAWHGVIKNPTAKKHNALKKLWSFHSRLIKVEQQCHKRVRV